MWKLGIAVSCALLLSAPPSVAHTPAADGCGTSANEYVRELTVMASAATGVSATATPVRVDLDRRYAINLQEQDRIRFRAAPGRATRVANARGGIFSFRTAAPGLYRVSLTSRHWVDLLDGGAVIESLRHFGPGCALVHKIVEFELPGDRDITLQLSGREDAIVGLAITAVPAAITTAGEAHAKQ